MESRRQGVVERARDLRRRAARQLYRRHRSGCNQAARPCQRKPPRVGADSGLPAHLRHRGMPDDEIGFGSNPDPRSQWRAAMSILDDLAQLVLTTASDAIVAADRDGVI